MSMHGFTASTSTITLTVVNLINFGKSTFNENDKAQPAAEITRHTAYIVVMYDFPR